MQIKQYSKIKYPKCLMNEKLSRETMTLNVVHKTNNKLKFLYCKNVFFDTESKAPSL